MLNIKEINKILNNLGLELIKKDNNYYMLNTNNNEMTLLNNSYEYKLEKDGINYIIQLFNNKLIISNSNNETLTLLNNEINYEEKENNSQYNKSAFLLVGNTINFYKKENLDEGFTSHSIKVSYYGEDFHFLKLSETIGLNGTLKNDITIQTDKNKTIRTNMMRKYNEEGKQIIGSIQHEEIEEDLNTYIDSIISEQELIPELFEQLNNFIPNLASILKDKDSHLKTIYEEKQKTI